MNFQQSLLQSSVSHDPSEIILICWFDAQETIIIIINVKTVVLLNIFLCEKKHDTFFSILRQIESNFHLKNFCNL